MRVDAALSGIDGGVEMPRGGKGYLYHYEAYDGPDNPYKYGLTETGTMTCAHCSVVVILNSQRERPREWCWNCNSYICDPCKGLWATFGCLTQDRTRELIVAHPNVDVRMERNINKEATAAEVELIEKTRIYKGITIPERSQ